MIAIGTVNVPVPELAQTLINEPYHASPLVIAFLFLCLNICQVAGSVIIINFADLNKN